MQITAIETIQLDEFPNLLWVHVHTDEGLVGLGETFFGPNAVAAYIHETAAPHLLGQDPLAIDRHSRTLLNTYLGFSGTGAEMRGNSAIDIALWDLFGQATGQPIYQLLGGLSRPCIRIYNTCAGYRYVRQNRGQLTDNWGLPQDDAGRAVRGPRRVPAPRRRARREPARPGHHGHEDLAVRPRRRGVGRPLHQPRRARPGARAVPQDPQRGRRPHGHHGRVPLAVEPADGQADLRARSRSSSRSGTRIRSR